jgi:type IV pilus assembly protein PilV
MVSAVDSDFPISIFHLFGLLSRGIRVVRNLLGIEHPAIERETAMKNICRSQQGFTLVELLVALTIFAIGLLAVAGMQVTAIQVNSSANSVTATTGLAEGALEEFMTLPADDPLVNTDQLAFADYWSPATRDIPGVGRYRAEYTVDADSPVTNVSTITVKVSGANSRTVTMTGFKCTQ